MTAFRFALAAALLGALTTGGCMEGQDQTRELGSLLDEAGSALAAHTEGMLLVAVNLPDAPEDQTFAEPWKSLARAETAFLLEAPAEGAENLALPAGATRAGVWGPSALLTRMGPRLRPELLSAWGTESAEPMRVMATFAAADETLRERLTQAGAEVSTVAGPVATLQAPPEALLTILRMDDLASLNRPREMKPSGQ